MGEGSELVSTLRHAGAPSIPSLLRRVSEAGLGFKDLYTRQSSLEDIFVSLVSRIRTRSCRETAWRFAHFEMSRFTRTVAQSIVAPVISTSLYFVVFGAALGSRMSQIGGVSYGAFIVPGLIMLALFTESLSNASFGIYFPAVHRDHLRDPVGADLVP